MEEPTTQVLAKENKTVTLNYPKVMEKPFYVATETHGICKERADKGPFDYQTIFSVFIVIFAIVLIVISSYCLCKNWGNGTNNEFEGRRRRDGLGSHVSDA